MGICISTVSAEIQDFGDSHDNVLLFEEASTVSPGIQRLGSLHSQSGSKGLNQDAAILYQGYGVGDGAFCGVFDGHGKNGHTVSKIVRNRLPSLLLNQMSAIMNLQERKYDSVMPNKIFRKWRKACVGAFTMMDNEIKRRADLDCSCSGTTAVAIVKQGDDLVIANLGDSRAVLGTITETGLVAVQLTTDLKPGLPLEADRIRKCKGRVLSLKQEPHIERVWLPNEDAPGLAMSRAFGDFLLKNHGIISIPDISYRRLASDDQFLVLATDGVWDALSNSQVARIVWAAESEEAAAKAVVDAATATWKRKFPSSKVDDCTAVCLFFAKEAAPA